MVGKYKVITLCGSTRFKDAFLETQKRLTLEENIVISVGLFGHSGDEEVWTSGTKEMLDDMHKRKIDMADEIYVINVGGYIGDSTRSEIEYALSSGKKVQYLLEPLAERKDKLPVVFFWKDDEENGCFSNWFRKPFVIDDFEYLFVEQYMMAQKAKLFHDSKCYTAILRATKPWECKELGKQVTPFDPAAWDAVKCDIVKKANRAKYEQNPDLMNKLIDTGNAILAEASPKDSIWGIGLDTSAASEVDPSEWPGQNLLGKILMELRAEFNQLP